MGRAPQPSLNEDRVVDAGLAVIGERGWRRTTLAAVAEELGVPVARVLEVVPSRLALLHAAVRRTDRQMLRGITAADEAEPHRDRLFDVVMRRFEVLAPHKKAVAALVREGVWDPGVTCGSSLWLRRSMALMLEAAGISTQGLWGQLRIEAFSGVYSYALSAWLRDDSPDMDRTMKALDKALDRAEGLERFVCGFVPRPLRPRRRDADRTPSRDTGEGEPGEEPA